MCPGCGAMPARRHRLEHAVVAAAAGRELEGTGDRADAGVAEIEQIVGGLAAGRAVVDGDRVDAALLERTAEKDDRHSLGQLAGAILVGGADRNEDRAVAAEHADAREDALLVLGLFVAVEDDERVAPGRHGGLRGVDHAGVERVGEVGHREGDELAAAALQAPRDLRGRVAEIAHGAQHAASQIGTDIGGIVDHRRDGRGRYASRLRDILDGSHCARS